MNPACHAGPAAVPAALREFLNGSRVRFDGIEWLDAAAVPQPCRDLLVHESEMTPTLEAFHRDRLRIQPLRVSEPGPDTYLREVLLLTGMSDRPVAYGAIEIHIDRFGPAEAQAIRLAHVPLGAIIVRSGIACRSRPAGFFRHDTAFALFDFPPRPCYGRFNRLLDAQDRPLASIFEILAPQEPARHPAREAARHPVAGVSESTETLI